ncbi:general secretion pathway protein GspK [Verticiella sediminum]|uniref:Type II secretion system protein K n=1 Tax=Verticiella sediminum TaxID=1247510 RepID=A0A556ACP2_9BURK|nr:type II secretion system minor pseudopilin GspK [Verticiella sediminum]TSH90651.1 general secretion pathway protein GspK [Verticiella sediminum]
MRPHRRSQHGMAVVAALVVVMVATVLVTGLLQRQATDVRALGNEMARAQARLLMTAGVDWARLILRSDGLRTAVTTRQGQMWATPIEDTRVALDGDRTAVLSGRIEDEQGKFNLRNLAQNGAVRDDDITALRRLLPLLDLPEGLAAFVAARIAAAQRDPGTASQDDEPARSARLPAAPMPTRLDDLGHMEVLGPAAIAALRPHVTLLPERTDVNVNTATPEVLAALTGLPLPAMRGVAAQRDAGQTFNDAAGFWLRIESIGVTSAKPNVVVNSNWFLVKGAVTLERAVVGTEALLQRGAAPSPEIVWIRELP